MSTELKTLNGYSFDATKLGGLDAKYYAQGRAAHQLLDNSWFVNPINQRGLSSYTGIGYCIDRWTAGTNISKTYINNGKSVAFYPETEGEAAYWRQYLDYSPNWLYGKTFTLAIKDVYGNTYVGTGTYPTEAPTSNKSVIWITMNTNRTFVLYCQTNGEAFVQLSTKDKQTIIVWAALYEGAYTKETLPDYIPKSVRQEMLDCGIPVAPHNLLDNSDFRNPVNQRGASAYGGSYYGIDRWYGNTPNQELQVRASDIVVFAGSTAFCGIRQKVGRIASLAGKTVTFAAQVYSNVSPRIAFLDASNKSLAQKDGIAATNQTLILTYTVPSDATADSVVPIIVARTQAAGDYIGIYWAALYEGSYDASTLPAYVPKGYAAELAECRRYYKVIDVYVAPWLQEGTNIRRYYVGYEPMRTAPTVDVSGLKEYRIWTDMKSTINPYNIKNNRVLLSATAETTSTSLYIGGSIALSSDL